MLIIDADIRVRHPLAEYLRGCGYRVLQASNTAQARRYFGQSDCSVNLVLVDAAAPEEGGFAFAQWVRTNHPGTQVLLAGSVEAAAKKAGDACEQGPALRKPYDHRIVADRIRRLLASGERRHSSK